MAIDLPKHHDGWCIDHTEGPAASFHARPAPWDTPSPSLRSATTSLTPESRPSAPHHHHPPPPSDSVDHPGLVWWHTVTEPTLVLGSSQSETVIDTAAATAAGWSVTGRRSGGGLVPLVPGHHIWIDVLLHRSHWLWTDDVIRAFDWLGQCWLKALSDLGVDDLEVHHGPWRDAAIGRQLCFGGLGPGEITEKGHKLVGISQRRTRSTTRLQSLVLLDHPTEDLLPLTRPPLHDVLRQPDLAPMGAPPDSALRHHDAPTIVAAFVAALPAPPP